jgi:hypothetical protein
MRLTKRDGGQPRVIRWDEFDALICRGINLFSFIRQLVDEYTRSYNPRKTIQSRLADHEPMIACTLYYDETTGAFGWITGKSPPEGYGKGVIQT